MNKRKPGRPKRPVTYSERLSIPLTPYQKQLVEEFAASRGYTGGTAPYFRELILELIQQAPAALLEGSIIDIEPIEIGKGGGNEKT